MKVLIVAAGQNDLENSEISDLCSSSDLIIAVDNGLSLLAKLNIRADILIGDLDSLEIQADSTFFSERIKYNSDKDKTDTELAIEYAISKGATFITVICALGGEIDHELGNIVLAAKYPGKLQIIGRKTKIIGVNSKNHYKILKGIYHDFVSIIPFPKIEGLTIKGLKYEIENQNIELSTFTLRNEFMSNQNVSISINSGIAILIIYSGNFYLEGK